MVHTRLEFAWLRPHPPLSALHPAHVWVPAGEDYYSGVNDRHAVLSRAAAEVDGGHFHSADGGHFLGTFTLPTAGTFTSDDGHFCFCATLSAFDRLDTCQVNLLEDREANSKLLEKLNELRLVARQEAAKSAVQAGEGKAGEGEEGAGGEDKKGEAIKKKKAEVGPEKARV